MKCLQNFQKMSRKFVAAMLVVAGFCLPAQAQRSCSAAVTLTNLAFSSPESHAKPSASGLTASLNSLPQAVVGGGGRGLLTDPDGETFEHQFSISAVVNDDGSASGKAEFVFPMLFAQKYGAFPGVADLMILKGEVTGGSVAQDGAVELTGPFLERDYNRSEGIVFEEDSRITGITPMKIVIAPNTETFELSWCAFIPAPGHFSIEVSKGKLQVR